MSASARQLLLLLALSLAMAAARWPGIESRSIWYDEAVTLFEVSGGTQPWPDGVVSAEAARGRLEGDATAAEIIQTLRDTDIHPPIYYLSLRAWRGMFGPSLEAARSLSMVAAAIMLFFFGLFLRDRVGLGQAALGMMILGLASSSVVAGYDARNYGFALMQACVLLWAVGRVEALRGRGRAAAAVAAGGIAGLMFQTHYLSLPLIGAVELWLLARCWREGRGAALLTVGVSLAVALPGWEVVLSQMGNRDHQDAGAAPLLAGLLDAFDTLGQAVYYPMIDLGTDAPSAWLRLASAAWLVPSLLASAAALRDPHAKRGLLTLGWLTLALPVLALLVLNQAFDKHLTAPRYLLMALPGVALLASDGLTRLLKGAERLRAPLIAAITLLQLTGITWTAAGTPGPHGHDVAREILPIMIDKAKGRALFLLGEGFRAGHPGIYVYELPGAESVVILKPGTTLAQVEPWLRAFDAVWFLPSREPPTAEVEAQVEGALHRLREPLVGSEFGVLFGPERPPAPTGSP